MDELELLKEDWSKNKNEFKNYSATEIYSIIKGKSVSLTKTLFLIGVVEVMLWTAYGFFNEDFPIIRIFLFVCVFVLAIWFFRKMKLSQSSKSLMKNILNLRKVILSYAGVSLVLIVIDHIIHFNLYTRDFMAGSYDAKSNNDFMTTDSEKMFPDFTNYIIFGIALMIFLYVLYLIYKMSYGKILSNLRRNYQELKGIDENTI